MVSFSNITQKKQTDLSSRMEKLEIYEKDLVEKFIRSSGSGGQHVNKTSTCVYLKHLPTGVEVKVRQERSQSLNRFLARRLLVQKIEQMVEGEKSKEEQRREKIRRQKRKRSKRAKEKMLREKKIQAEKKKSRSFTASPDDD